MQINQQMLAEALACDPSRITKSGLAELTLAVRDAWLAEREAWAALEDLSFERKFATRKGTTEEVEEAQRNEDRHRMLVWHPAFEARKRALEALNSALGIKLSV